MNRPAEAGNRNERRLGLAFALIVAYGVVQVVAAFATGSLSLLSDAGHMGVDALGLGMALTALIAARRARRRERQTFGLHRLEVMAALANAGLLLAVAIYSIVEGIRRIGDPPWIAAGPMLWVAVGGLVVNLVAALVLRSSAHDNLNMEGAYGEVVSDLLGSVGVILAAILYLSIGWAAADAWVAVLIGTWILPRAIRLGWKALAVLVQSAPRRLDLSVVKAGLAGIEGVVDVHDLHVWTLTSDMDVATAHLVVAESADSHRVLDQAGDTLRGRWGISHATLQVEPESHRECVEETW